MSEWLQIDASTGDGWLDKALPGTLGNGFTIELDAFLSSDTASAIVGASSAFSADWFQYFRSGGVFAQTPDGGTTWEQSSDFTPNGINGTIPVDTSFHVTVAAVWNSGASAWDITVSIDGTPVDTFQRASGSPATSRGTLSVGALLANHVSGEIYWLTNVVYKDEFGATVFSDDFTSGDTSAWPTSHNPSRLAVVSAPTSGGGAGGSPTPPDNTDCATAQTLVGCSGTTEADNRAWAGTWATGDDPLFNALGVGGGAPLFYEWTNTRGRPMLFRVTIQAPADHAVNYNFGIGIAANCASLVFQNDGDNFVTDRFNLAQEFGNLQEQLAASNVNPSTPNSFDIVVNAGHTVRFEIDSYSGDASEPPDASAHLGKFQFAWSALEFTTFDTTQSALHALPTDTSTLLDNDASATGASNITPYATRIVAGHLYLLFIVNEADGDSIFAGDCNLDGSSLNVQRVWDASAVDPGGIIQGDVPRLLTDGTDVFVGFGWQETTDNHANPGNTDTCSDYPAVAVCADCASTGRKFRYSIFKFAGAGTWGEMVHSGPGDPTLINFTPDFSSFGTSLSIRDYQVRACASPAQPGKIWVHAAYRITQVDQSLHANDYPITGSPTGSRWCTDDKIYVTEFVTTIEVDVATSLTSAATVSNRLGYVQQWNHDDPHSDPVFGPWQFFDDGDLVTDPDTPRPSLAYGGFDLKNDDGYPLLAYCRRTTVTPRTWTATYANDVVFKRLDTTAVLGTWSYDDIAAGYESDGSRGCTELAITERFTDPDDSIVKRGLATHWPGSPIREWTDLIVSDGSAAPAYIVAGDVNSSLGWFFGWLLPDTLVDGGRQWWAQIGPYLTLVDSCTTFQHYDYCDTPGWKATWDGWHGPDDLGANYIISSLSAYDAGSELFYFVTANNQLRRARVLRNYFICDEGAPCSGLFAGLYADVIF